MRQMKRQVATLSPEAQAFLASLPPGTLPPLIDGKRMVRGFVTRRLGPTVDVVGVPDLDSPFDGADPTPHGTSTLDPEMQVVKRRASRPTETAVYRGLFGH